MFNRGFDLMIVLSGIFFFAALICLFIEFDKPSPSEEIAELEERIRRFENRKYERANEPFFYLIFFTNLIAESN